MYEFFNKLEDIQILATRAPTQISEGGLIAQAYMSIKNTGIYDRAINKWDKTIAPYKIWYNFKHYIIMQTD